MNEELRFPDGATVEQAKKDAKKLAASMNIPLSEALDTTASHHGGVGKWQDVIRNLKANGVEDLPRCCVCDETEAKFSRTLRAGGGPLPVLTPLAISPSSLLIPVGYSDELIHRKCVDGVDYDFCNYCGEERAHRAEDLNSMGECTDHAGESALSEDEQTDLEDLAENLLNNT